MSFLSTIKDPHTIITSIEHGLTFPEKMDVMLARYEEDIELFKKMVLSSPSSTNLLEHIRSSSIPAKKRMSLLKIFRRCVSLVCDTEMTKKITKVPTDVLVRNFGHTFKPIEELREDFENLSKDRIAALAMLIGEYDERGQLGYIFTNLFFSWFDKRFQELTIEGPRGAGKDIELSELFEDFSGSYPCDLVIKDQNQKVLAIGFARYDSTRGGAQSDNRTGGNEVKVFKAQEYASRSGNFFKIIFAADGPGLAHRDTWEAACQLDDMWDGNVRVTTLRIANQRITSDWLTS